MRSGWSGECRPAPPALWRWRAQILEGAGRPKPDEQRQPEVGQPLYAVVSIGDRSDDCPPEVVDGGVQVVRRAGALGPGQQGKPDVGVQRGAVGVLFGSAYGGLPALRDGGVQVVVGSGPMETGQQGGREGGVHGGAIGVVRSGGGHRLPAHCDGGIQVLVGSAPVETGQQGAPQIAQPPRPAGMVFGSGFHHALPQSDRAGERFRGGPAQRVLEYSDSQRSCRIGEGRQQPSWQVGHSGGEAQGQRPDGIPEIGVSFTRGQRQGAVPVEPAECRPRFEVTLWADVREGSGFTESLRPQRRRRIVTLIDSPQSRPHRCQ